MSLFRPSMLATRVQGARLREPGTEPPGPEAPLCSHYLRGACRYGADCSWRHAEPDNQSDTSELAACQRAYRAAEVRLNALRTANATREAITTVAAELNELRPRLRELTDLAVQGAATRRRLNKGGRAAIFREFLVRTYGETTLASGSGVVDVAGGQGALAFGLLHAHGVASTIVDPRAARRKPSARQWTASRDQPTGRQPRHWAIHWRDELWQPIVPPRTSTQGEVAHGGSSEAAAPSARDVQVMSRPASGGCAAFEAESLEKLEIALSSVPPQQSSSARRARKQQRAPPSVQSAATPPSVQSAVDDVGEEGTPDEEDEDASTPISTAASTPAATPIPAPLHDATAACLPSVPSAREVWTTLQHCSAVVGMHPDGATESIVEFALRANKPLCARTMAMLDRTRLLSVFASLGSSLTPRVCAGLADWLVGWLID